MLHQTLSFLLILASGVVAPHQATRAAKPKSTVQVLGDFTRLRYPGDDAFGYSLQLWKQGDHVFGLLAVYVGPPADPPTGLLEDVTFDPRTRRFSFSARLSTGFVHAAGDKWAPTQDRFTFRGTLSRTAVTGTLQQFDVLRPDEPLLSKQIKLRLAKHLSEDLMPAPASYEEWRKWADEILQRRGPHAGRTDRFMRLVTNTIANRQHKTAPRAADRCGSVRA